MKTRKPIKYGASKLMLTSFSILAFGWTAALVSMKGPLSSSTSAAQSASQAVKQSYTFDDGGGSTSYDDGSGYYRNSGSAYSQSANAPVARSRGS